MKTVLKSILVFQDGNLIETLKYKTKKEAIGNFRLFRKYGKLSSSTFEKIENAHFELL
jgi:hypothetical protein